MITELDLENLGYNKKQDLLNKSKDFIYRKGGYRNYLINLTADGTITVVYPLNSKAKQLIFTELDDFTEWHNSQ